MYRKYSNQNISDIPTYNVSQNNQTGSLEIITEPVGASILIDNESKGLTPLIIEDLDVGKHRVIINNEGFERKIEPIFIFADSLVKLNFNRNLNMLN